MLRYITAKNCPYDRRPIRDRNLRVSAGCLADTLNVTAVLEDLGHGVDRSAGVREGELSIAAPSHSPD